MDTLVSRFFITWKGASRVSVFENLYCQVPLKLNGVRQDETDFFLQNAWRDELSNSAARLFPDPVIDRLLGLLSVGEIDRARFSSVVLKSRFQERGLKMKASLSPLAIGHAQLVVLTLGVQNGVERAEAVLQLWIG
jgi:hypothetical protein